MKRFLRTLLLLTLPAAVGAGGLFFYATYDYASPGALSSPVTVMITPGTGFKAIARQLAEAGVVSHPELFMAEVMLAGKQREFKAGEYAFPPGVTPQRVVDMLVKGDVVVYSVTLPEGLTSQEILALLAAEETLTGDLPASVPEGSLLPETYQFVRGDARRGILTRMQKAMRETLAALWKNRRDGLPLSTPEDAVILASIVEKETGIPEERGRVAAVFINRLEAGMKLQSDPTVIYGLYRETGEKPIRLRKEDVERPTLYNTYAVQGLPPAPIANPGKASLEAVLHAPVTEEFYFVADGTGGHRFARTLNEHNRNVRQWKRFRAKAR